MDITEVENKFHFEVSNDVTVVSKEDTYSDIGFWNGTVKIDMHEQSCYQKLLHEQWFKQFTEKMEVGKEYKISIEITEL